MSLATMTNSILRYVPGLNPLLIEGFLQDAYRKLAALDWNRLNVTRTISTVAPYRDGTVTVASDGTCTGIGTNWTTAMVGSFMKVYYSDAFFEITDVADPTTLTLRDWSGLAITTATPYTIFRIIYPIPISIGHIFSVNYTVPLLKRTQEHFNRLDPSRRSSGQPVWWAFAGIGSQQSLNIEVYPVPDAAYPLRIYGKVRIETLAPSASPLLPEDLVEASALLECYRFKMQQDKTPDWQSRYAEQMLIFNNLFQVYREEDFLLGDSRTQTKDVSGAIPFTASDYFAVNHDID